MNLKEYLYALYDELVEGCGYTFEEILSLLCEKDSKNNYTINYKKLYLQKCIVNNEKRVKLGEGLDLFVQEDGFLYKFVPSSSTTCTPIYRFDKDSARKKKEANLVRQKNLLDDFMSDYVGNTIKFEPHCKSKNKTCIVIGCTQSKNNLQNVPALNLYAGPEFILYKDICQRLDIDMYIISAKYGLISSEFILSPYNKSFLELSLRDIDILCPRLGIRKNFDKILSCGYENIFLCLGEKYLRTLQVRKTLLNSDSNIIILSQDKNKDTHNRCSEAINVFLPTSQLLDYYNCTCLELKAFIMKDILTRQIAPQEIQNYIDNLKSSVRKKKLF